MQASEPVKLIVSEAGKIQVVPEQLPWTSHLVIYTRPKVTEQIVPGNFGARDLVVRCTSVSGQVSFSGGFSATVGQNVLEVGSGEAFLGTLQLKAAKNARITAG